ncbi:hypothetical protein JTE90_026336 [Oedothorax gibbosus]|uniref:Uncharacterized protein n=1 Tax=Oedothorax gibbosus TaxID=931172 RepID=A0AAV6U4M2_9ARAC|nr:hypothetical protein JTE90_026336 [Oedothorax gibbosus]
MNRDKKLLKILQHVWDFISYKIVLTSERPVIEATLDINTEMIELLRIVVWTGTYVSLSEWRRFLYEHYVRMTISPKDFATYVVYALYTSKKTSEQSNFDAFQIFVSTMSLAVQLALYSNEDRQAELLPMSQEIFIEFFEKELKKGFHKKGGWNALFDFLEQRKPLQLFRMLERWEEEGYTPGQIVKLLGVVHSRTDPLRAYLSRGVKSSEVESYRHSSRILNSLDFLNEKNRDKLDSNNTSNTSLKESPSKLAGQKSHSATESGDSIKEEVQEPDVKLGGRITTREVYFRAKCIIQELRLDFYMLGELLEFVFGDSSVKS